MKYFVHLNPDPVIVKILDYNLALRIAVAKKIKQLQPIIDAGQNTLEQMKQFFDSKHCIA